MRMRVDRHFLLFALFILHWLNGQGVGWNRALLKIKKEVNNFNFGFSHMDNVSFHPDRFEILVDARGFRPEEIKCMITPRSVEIFAQKEEFQNTQKRVALTRQYVLPQNAVPENGNCCLSSEGILLVTAPWSK